MSDLLIMGLDAPEKCNGCCVNLAGHCLANKGLYVGRDNLEYNSKPDWCPVMNIQPHGRCIDADALIKLIVEQEQSEYNKQHAPLSWAGAMRCFEEMVNDAHNIIPASK